MASDRWMSADDVREVYADQADTMARIAPVNRLLTGRYRRDLFGRAEGRVLDVACGMGMNRDYLPDGVEYVGVDLSPEMLAKAEARDHRLERGETLFEMNAANLAFDDDEFDTVVSSLSTCTFPDPIAALREMARVCKPDGTIRLLEHGRSDVGPVARFQEWGADAHYEREGCRWTQEPLENVTEAGLVVRDVQTGFLGMITAIEAEPLDEGA
jgi:ubiquinone/menaquinone biosynthesis C-methylase UbiE